MKDTEEQATAEQPVETSLADELGKAYDELAGDEDDNGTDVNAGSDPDGEELGEGGDNSADAEEEDSGDAVDKPDDDPDGDQEEGDNEDIEPEKLTAPEHWSQAHKDTFSKLDTEGQEFLLSRHKDMEADYTRKTQEVAEVKRFKDNFEQMYGPYRNHFATQGLDEQGAIRSLLGWYSSIQQDPKRAISALAQQYGVTNEQPAEEGFTDPAIKALQDKLSDIEARNIQNQRAQQEASVKSVQDQITAFSSETNTDGSLKYPHFEKVKADMGIAIQANPSLTLDAAYIKAVRLDDALFSEEQNKTQAQKEIEKKGKAKQKIAQAKKAASGIKSGSASVKKDKPNTLEDDLAAEYDRQANGQHTNKEALNGYYQHW